MAAENLTGEDDRLEIYLDDLVELVFRNFKKRCRGIDPGSVDQDIDFSRTLENLIAQRFETFASGDVGGDKISASSALANPSQTHVGLLLTAANERNLDAGFRQTFGHRAAKFAGAADDDSSFSLQGKKFIQIIFVHFYLPKTTQLRNH